MKKNGHAQALGRLGGAARAKSLTKRALSAIGSKGAKAKWKKWRQERRNRLTPA